MSTIKACDVHCAKGELENAVFEHEELALPIAGLESKSNMKTMTENTHIFIEELANNHINYRAKYSKKGISLLFDYSSVPGVEITQQHNLRNSQMVF